MAISITVFLIIPISYVLVGTLQQSQSTRNGFNLDETRLPDALRSAPYKL